MRPQINQPAFFATLFRNSFFNALKISYTPCRNAADQHIIADALNNAGASRNNAGVSDRCFSENGNSAAYPRSFSHGLTEFSAFSSSSFRIAYLMPPCLKRNFRSDIAIIRNIHASVSVTHNVSVPRLLCRRLYHIRKRQGELFLF